MSIDPPMFGAIRPYRRRKGLARQLLLMLAVSIAPCVTAAEKDTAALRLTRYLEACRDVAVCNGTYLVVQGDRVVYQGSMGLASSTGDEPLGPDHAFDIGSISKQFTAAAVMRLVEQGRLQLEDPVVAHSPRFPYPAVTVRHLLTHTSGLPDLMSLYPRTQAIPATRPVLFRDAVDVLADKAVALRFEPGSRFEYSNGGYVVLADVVERAAGVPFHDFLQQSFFRPLGMTRTRLRTPENEHLIMPRAYGFVPLPDGQRRPRDQIANLYVRGGGGIYSTVQDLHIWMRAMQAGRAITSASWKTATAPTVLNDGSLVPYGFGLSLKPSKRGASRVSHGGHWRGFKADLTLWPTRDLVAVQLTNNGEDDSVEQVRDAIEQIVAGETPAPVREPVHRPLRARLERDSLASVKTWLDTELAARPSTYDFREAPMNRLGYDLLDAKMPDKAIVVFEAVTRAHPTSLNAYDSLADAYLAAERRPLAIQALRQVLQLDPHSASAKARLRSLQETP